MKGRLAKARPGGVLGRFEIETLKRKRTVSAW
jgi:hypothetical protein